MNEIRKLSMLDFMMNLLKKWKKIVIVMVVMGILAGVFSFIQNRNSKEATPSDQVTKNYSEADQKVYARQEEALATYQSYYEMYTKYLDESIKMQINPEEVFEGTLSCLISGATQEDVLRLRSKCDEIVKSKEFFDMVRTRLGIDSEDAYIHELISIGFEPYENEVGLMSFKVIHFDEEACRNILEIIQSGIEQIKSDVGQCEILTSDILKTKKMSLAADKENYYNLKWNYYDHLARVREDRKNLEMSYSTALVEPESQTKSSNIIYIIIGLVAGGVLAVMFYGIRYLFSEYVHTQKDINGLQEVSIVSVTNEKKEAKGIVDSWLDKWEKKTGNKPNGSLEMSVLPIIMSVKQKNLSEICLTGSLFKSQQCCKLAKQVQVVFEKYGIKVLILNSILTDLHAVQTLVNTGNIVFYEVCEKTKHKDICEEVLKAQQCGVDIQGIIIEKR